MGGVLPPHTGLPRRLLTVAAGAAGFSRPANLCYIGGVDNRNGIMVNNKPSACAELPRPPLAAFLLLFCQQLAAWEGSVCPAGDVPAAHDDPVLRVATLNIAHGRGTSLNQLLIGRDRIAANLDRAGRLLAGFELDVLALQELDASSRWSGYFDHGERLVASAGFNCSIKAVHAESWFYRFGTGLLSRARLEDANMRSFEPTPPTTTKGLVAGTLRWRQGDRGDAVRVVSVHLDFSRKAARLRQLEAIIAAIENSPVPLIVMGDFNEDWSSDDSVVRQLVDDAGLVAYRPQAEDLATYKDKRLDWILISRDLQFQDYRVIPDPVSDHRLVTAAIQWRAQP